MFLPAIFFLGGDLVDGVDLVLGGDFGVEAQEALKNFPTVLP